MNKINNIMKDIKNTRVKIKNIMKEINITKVTIVTTNQKIILKNYYFFLEKQTRKTHNLILSLKDMKFQETTNQPKYKLKARNQFIVIKINQIAVVFLNL